MKLFFNKESIDCNEQISLFICTIGFEERSKYIVEQLFNDGAITKNQILCFYFKDNRNEISEENFKKISNLNIHPIDIDKTNHALMLDIVNQRIINLQGKNDKLQIYIDYSSMPRNWYANLLLELVKVKRERDKICFWYAHGDYSEDTKHCSTAGADDFIIFSGKASIKPLKRSHILGLGYDIIKSDAIRTVVDPSTLIVCYTFPKDNFVIKKTIQKEHKIILDASAFSFSLPIEDFNVIVKKILEIVLELQDQGDVILIPDGPKPLILACSIIPKIIDKVGIVCFHVKSHSNNFIPENIRATGVITGFSVSQK